MDTKEYYEFWANRMAGCSFMMTTILRILSIPEPEFIDEPQYIRSGLQLIQKVLMEIADKYTITLKNPES